MAASQKASAVFNVAKSDPKSAEVNGCPPINVHVR